MVTEGGEVKMHEGVQRYNVPEIQEIVQRLPNQGERVAEGDSNSFNVVVGVAPMICRGSIPVLLLMDVLTDGVRK